MGTGEGIRGAGREERRAGKQEERHKDRQGGRRRGLAANRQGQDVWAGL